MLCGQECLQINLLPIIDKWPSGICIYLPDLSPMHRMGCPALRWPLQESGMSTIHMHLKTLKHKGQNLHDRCSTPNRTVAEEPMWDRKKWESLMSGPIWVSNRFLLYLDFWFSIKCWDIDGPKFKHTNIAAIIIQRYHWRAIPTDHLDGLKDGFHKASQNLQRFYACLKSFMLSQWQYTATRITGPVRGTTKL